MLIFWKVKGCAVNWEQLENSFNNCFVKGCEQNCKNCRSNFMKFWKVVPGIESWRCCHQLCMDSHNCNFWVGFSLFFFFERKFGVVFSFYWHNFGTVFLNFLFWKKISFKIQFWLGFLLKENLLLCFSIPWLMYLSTIFYHTSSVFFHGTKCITQLRNSASSFHRLSSSIAKLSLQLPLAE